MQATPIQLQSRLVEIGSSLRTVRKELSGLEGNAAPVGAGWGQRFEAAAAELDGARAGLLELMPQQQELAAGLSRDVALLGSKGASLDAMHARGDNHTWGVARSLASPMSNVRRAVGLLELTTGVPAAAHAAAAGPGDHTGGDVWGSHAGLEPGDHS